ncbi:chromosome transmission fidelity protein 18 homolog [Tiliqua scincoides]|uniref:chromosome transmission fidelity protein 18 homolog n=1 Tax=Tiliqua scincoides TaxID=71010 RepID=UPI003461ECB0
MEGPEDGFAERFADELEALAELEAHQVPSHKVSKFRNGKRTFEEALSSGDLVKGSLVTSCLPCLDESHGGPVLSAGSVVHADLKSQVPVPVEVAEGSSQRCFPQEADGIHTPKPKRRRHEAVKKLDFGMEDQAALKERLQDGEAPPLSPRSASELQDTRNPKFAISDSTDLGSMLPLHSTPPAEKDSKKVLKRPPILENYINVTSTNGTRVFMVVKDDCSHTGTELSGFTGWKGQRQLHLLGVPFSYLKEQVAEEQQRQILESSQRLTEIFNSCLGEGEVQMETTENMKEEENKDGAAEDQLAHHSLWVDRFTPRHYIELLSDDYTNRCLLKWLKLWDTVVFGKEKPVKKAKPSAVDHQPFKHPKEQQGKWKSKTQLTEEALEAELDPQNRPKYKVALLCGPPGLGKTTLAHVIVKHAGYNVVEMNASDDRSPDVFRTRIEAATQMKSVLGANEKPNCLIIDEIDGAATASINVLLSILNSKATEAELEGSSSGKKRKSEGGLLLRPIICICNDQYVPSLRQLRQQAFLLNFPPTAPHRLVQRLHEIAVQKGMKADMGALAALCEKAENDIRSCINTLQFLHSRGKKELNSRMVQTTSVGLKDQNKGLFSIWQEVFQLPKAQRQRIGADPSLPTHILTDGGDYLFSLAAGSTSLNAATQRFHRILHLSTSSGEHEKLTQGLYDNFLNMKVKDSGLGSVGLALEWLSFVDLVNKAVMQGQNFQLMRYLPFLPVSFHLLFAASSIPRLAYPNSQQEALAKRTQMQNLLASMISGITPNSRSRTGSQALILETLCFLLDIISPKLRPVNTQLYSQKEKQQLAELISTMLAYNLTYHQERTPDGQYIYKLDPNVEEVCRFPDLPTQKPLTYQAKQLIAREIELEKMRRTEAVLQVQNSHQATEMGSLAKGGDQKASMEPALPKPRIQNHEQRLDQIVKRATFNEKPEMDFFGRVIVKKMVLPSAANQGPEKNTLEKQIGKAVGQSDVWFRFNEGFSNAVRRNIYVKDLL